MKTRLAAFMMAVLFMASIPTLAHAAQKKDVLADTAAVVLEGFKASRSDSLGLEWAGIGLARSGYDVPEELYARYHANVAAYTKACEGVFSDRIYSDYSRVILSLTATGGDPRNVGGYDLLVMLGDFERVMWQGVNGAALALLALDSADYIIPENPNAQTQADRHMYINEILSRQLNDGGFSLRGGTSEAAKKQTADPDITAMVLQALVKYKHLPQVQTAIDKALTCLSVTQDENGGFTSWNLTASETVSQVITALCGLGIPLDDARFVKNGNSLLDNLMTYHIEGEGFKHLAADTKMNRIATDQALYCLVALQRMNDGKPWLYDMSDAIVLTVQTPTDVAGLPGKHPDVRVIPVKPAGATFTDIAGHPNSASIEALAARGIISGRGGGIFAPDDTMTRAELATIVVNGLGLPAKAEAIFADVPMGEWYTGTVGAAYGYGIINGTSETTFTPMGILTRAEAAAMMTNAAKLCGMNTAISTDEARNVLAQFGDYMTTPAWARSPLAFAYREGILSDAAFDIFPLEKITRAEVADMLFRMLDAAQLL